MLRRHRRSRPAHPSARSDAGAEAVAVPFGEGLLDGELLGDALLGDDLLGGDLLGQDLGRGEGAATRSRFGRAGLLRLLLVGVVVATLVTLGIQISLTQELTADTVRAQVAGAGFLGFLAYVGIFVGGQLAHLPGLIFIGGGAVAWGPHLGGPAALVAGLVAVSANFMFIRLLGGQPAAALNNRWAARLLRLLDERPLTAVMLIRLVFFTSPAMSAALALTNVRFRDHLVGSAVGMAPAILLGAYFIDYLL